VKKALGSLLTLSFAIIVYLFLAVDVSTSVPQTAWCSQFVTSVPAIITKREVSLIQNLVLALQYSIGTFTTAVGWRGGTVCFATG
jgi:hypothetical protein